MLFVLSPAKSLDFTPVEGAPHTAPRFAKDTRELARIARKLTRADLKRLMSISDKLADLNRERFQSFDPDSAEGVQAAFAFNGDVYDGLQARTLDPEALAWAQDHLRILSGLYGVLRPLDGIQPYRLEMGIRLASRRGDDLYGFWGPRIGKALGAEAREQADPTVVNLASQEYFRSVDLKALKVPVVSCRFLEEANGASRIVSFYAKKARGMMARWAIDQRAERVADLRGFDTAGYRFQESLSSEAELTFSRPHP
jgi:cytoplasmic iron level regulating protein YaaA (DUF328/UPF0246 family)